MYDNVYEEYIRSMIGNYPNFSSRDYYNYGNNIYETYDEFNNYRNAQMNDTTYLANDLEECYPESYKLIYPMIKKVCMKNTRSLSKDLIDEMVEEVYSNFIEDEPIELNINLNNEVRSSKDSENSNSRSNNVNSKTASQNNLTVSKMEGTSKLDRATENRQTRQRNPILNDLIRILILRELLERPGGIFRPPFPGRPPQRPPQNFPPNRPPFPGRPRENRLNTNQQSNYSSYSSDMFENSFNALEF